MSIINRTMYPVQTSMSLISKMQERFATLQTQLATGQKASTLAEMGSDRYFDLSIRARINRIEGYKNNVDMVNVRLEVFDQVVSRLDKVESDARGALSPSNYGSSNINFGTVPALAQDARWVAFAPKIQALIEEMENKILKPAPFSPLR